DFADVLPTLADAAGVSPSDYYTDGKSFYEILTGEESSNSKDELFIHYSPRWGRFSHDRWVMNETYKLYRDGRFYNTFEDPLEKHPLAQYSGKEEKLVEEFKALLKEWEEKIPFEQNDTSYKVKQ
ncbi:MAG: hypothetical protein ACOC0R_03975, partial [Mariniphaga sp.]